MLDGTESNHEVAATLDYLFRELGHDAAMLKNYTSPGGMTGQNILVVRDPNQLRSPWAAFDPTKIDSADLLAARVPFGPIATLNQKHDAEAAAAWAAENPDLAKVGLEQGQI